MRELIDSTATRALFKDDSSINIREVMYSDSEKIVFKEQNRIKVFDKNKKDTLSIDEVSGDLKIEHQNGIATYSTNDNRKSWFPKEYLEDITENIAAKHGYYNAINSISRSDFSYLFEDDELDAKIPEKKGVVDLGEAIDSFVKKTVETATKNVKDTSINLGSGNKMSNCTINGSSVITTSNEVIVNGKHYDKPKNASVSVNNGVVKINGKKAISKEEQLKLDRMHEAGCNHSGCTVAVGYAPDCTPKVDKKENIKKENTLEYRGHYLPPCPDAIVSRGKVTNIIETKDAIFCGRYELVNGKWKKTFRAKLKNFLKN